MPLADLCLTALVGTYLVGSVRIGPAEAAGGSLLVLGPLTVDPSFSDRGIGSALMQASLDAARSAGHGLVVLVGDAPYYRRFGFEPVPAGTPRAAGAGRSGPLSLAGIARGRERRPLGCDPAGPGAVRPRSDRVESGGRSR